MKPIRYKSSARPGLGGKAFRITLNTDKLVSGDILTNDLDNGHCMMLFSNTACTYKVKYIATDKRAFFPPELLKPNQSLYLLTIREQIDNIKIV